MPVNNGPYYTFIRLGEDNLWKNIPLIADGAQHLLTNQGTQIQTTGSAVQLIQVNNSGDLSLFTSTIGSANQPVYCANGIITTCTATVGSATQPTYFDNGVIKQCSRSIPEIIYSNGILTIHS